jgi:DegV family protein with EDD domain
VWRRRIGYGAGMPASKPTVAVVTDSTAALPAALTTGLTVVPLTVVIDGTEGREGVDVAPDAVAAALTSQRPVSTSRPAPWMFVAEYERLLGMGYAGVLSIHLSAKLSGTWESAALAAADFDGRVEVLDSGAAGMGLGFPAVRAAAAAAGGADLAGVRAAATSAIERTVTLFYVDTLEYMRRGGRLGATQAALGTALAVKPILGMSEGAVVPLEKVRTGSRAIARVVERAVSFAGESIVDIAVQHAAAPERATALADALTSRLRVRERYVGEVGAVLAAHSGPGLVCAVLHRALAD